MHQNEVLNTQVGVMYTNMQVKRNEMLHFIKKPKIQNWRLHVLKTTEKWYLFTSSTNIDQDYSECWHFPSFVL